MYRINNLKLSVIVPVFNGEKYILDCLSSILRQDLSSCDYEIIILNDGSTDDTQNICESFAASNSHVRLYTQQNIGISATRNKGLSLARGSYIYFIDADDYLADQSLKKILKYALKHDLDVLGFDYIRTSDRDFIEPINFKNAFKSGEIQDGPTYLENEFYYGSPWWYIYKRSFFNGLNLEFNERLFALEDIIFTITLLLSAKRVAFADVKVYRYFVNETSILVNKEKEHYLKIIHAMKLAIKCLDEIIKTSHKIHRNRKTTRRLKSRQEAILFFLLVRAYKSTLTYNELRNIIGEMRLMGIYPMKNFISKDFNNLIFRVLSVIFNQYQLMAFSFRLFRMTYPEINHIIPRYRVTRYAT